MSTTKTAIDIALDRKAENARELGLDYEPAQQEPVAWCVINNGEIIGEPTLYLDGAEEILAGQHPSTHPHLRYRWHSAHG